MRAQTEAQARVQLEKRLKELEARLSNHKNDSKTC